MRLVIVTGMSGAGKTSALKMLEDMGFYCVDNLPIPLVEKFAELTLSNQGGIKDAALGIDIRSGDELSALNRIFDEWSRSRVPYEILFLDAGSETLIKRYKESRRIHPLAGEGRIDSGIEKERLKLAFLKEEADYIIDTSKLLTKELKAELESPMPESWKRSLWQMKAIRICTSRFCPLASNTESLLMQISSLTSDSFRIRIMWTNCVRRRARTGKCGNT